MGNPGHELEWGSLRADIRPTIWPCRLGGHRHFSHFQEATMSIVAFRHEFERHVAILEQAIAQLTAEQLLRSPYAGGTTITGLLTHISSFLTARFTDILTVDTNDRPWRNHQADLASTKPLAVLQSEWNVALAAVRGTLAGLRDSDLNAPIRLGDQRITLEEGLSRFGTHFSYHTGQIVVSARTLLGTAWKPLQNKPLRQPFEFRLVNGPQGPITTAIATPAGSGPHPAVIIGQEGLGVTGHLLGLAHRFAAAGYLAIIPDLYSRDPSRRNLHESEVAAFNPLARQADPAAAIAALPADKQPAALRVVSWFTSRDTGTYQGDVAATLAWARSQPQVRSQHIGAIGFSFGGGLVSQLAAAGAPLAAAVVVYGQLPAAEQVAGMRSPLLGHFAGDDPAINGAIPAVAAAFTASKREFAQVTHAGTKHGFFNETRRVYDAVASDKVWQSVLGFFGRHLHAVAARAAG
jgi:carboxymethylenebutenolidase